MKARLIESEPVGNDWFFEIKFDGFRAIAVKKKGAISLYSRSGKSFNADFPTIVEALKDYPLDFTVDGEIVALDEKGRSSFQLLQNARKDRIGSRLLLRYFVFDLLNLKHHDTTGLPIESRKELLESVFKDARFPICISENLKGNIKSILAKIKKQGLEGIIAKRKGSFYEPDRRSGSWVKLKCVNEQEFVIGGYTPPRGSRRYFGALLIGYYKGKELMFCSKIGTGFDENRLETLYQSFQKLKTATCPFANLPEKTESGDPGGMTVGEMRRCNWLKPALVCEVRFSEWTHGGHLRVPVFLGIRSDKKPSEVIRERPGVTPR